MIEVYNEYNQLQFRMGLDWLKFRFAYQNEGSADTEFYYDDMNKQSRVYFDSIFSALKLDYDQYDDEKRAGGWGAIRKYGNMSLCLSPSERMRHTRYGQDYMLFELSGEACREFERRGGDWKQLLIMISLNENFEFYAEDNAIDICTDKYFSQSELISKICNNEYKGSSHKKPQDIFQVNSNGLLTNAWSFTWGKHGGNQICIYNKAMEQAKKLNKSELIGKYWVRIEIRSRGDEAAIVGREMVGYYNQGNIKDFYASLLSKKFNLIEKQVTHTSRDAKIWKPWQDLVNDLGNVENFKTTIGNKVSGMPQVVYKWFNWLCKSVAPTMQKLYAIAPEYFDNLLSIIYKVQFLDQVAYVQPVELRYINEARAQLGKPPLTNVNDQYKKLFRMSEREEEESKSNELYQMLNSFMDLFKNAKEDNHSKKVDFIRGLEDKLLPF